MTDEELFDTDNVAADEPSEQVSVVPEAAETDAPAAELPEAKWYILHTYSGYENLVKVNLETSFKQSNIDDRLVDIRIPMEDIVEERNGRRKVVQRRMFPSYVLVKMIYTRDMWHLITGTRGVTGFVGPQGRPTPLTDEEIRRMQLEKVTVKTDFAVGDSIRVVNGPLTDRTGEIKSINQTTGKCSVDINMFGRMIPAELDMYQLEKIDL